MKRLITSALAAAVVAAGTASEVQGQEAMRRASLFDLGLYAGGAYTTAWFEDSAEESYEVGLSPIFGLTATYWATPRFGIRAHGAYMPSNLPEGEEGDLGENDSWVMNNWFYDLNLVFRPWMALDRPGNWMSSTYFFLGGGGLTTNVQGENPVNCVLAPVYTTEGVCVPTDPSLGSVGQGVVGLGFDAMALTPSIGIFGELAVHGYDSPAHVYGPNNDEKDKVAFTPRASLGIKFGFGDRTPEPIVVVPPPLPPRDTMPTPPPPPMLRDIQVCVVENGALMNVDAKYNPATGDTTVNGQAFSMRYPATTGYAAGAPWYINSEPITFSGETYVKFGLPRVLGVTEVTRIGDQMGVPVFAEPGATGAPEIVYIPVRPGCEFQPYQKEVKVRGVRG